MEMLFLNFPLNIIYFFIDLMKILEFDINDITISIKNIHKEGL